MLTLILSLLMLVLRAMEFVILIWLMSWLPGAKQSALGQLLGRIAGIVVDPIRRVMPRTGIIDFTPLIGLLLLQAAQVGLRAIAQAF